MDGDSGRFRAAEYGGIGFFAVASEDGVLELGVGEILYAALQYSPSRGGVALPYNHPPPSAVGWSGAETYRFPDADMDCDGLFVDEGG